MTDSTTVATIGETIVINGEVSGDEDLVIDGQVEGNINLNQNVLTVGEHGKVKAAVVAKTVVVAGKVRGNIMAAEKVRIRDTCSMEGDICTPAVGDGRWGLFPWRRRHAAVAKRKAGRDVRRR